MSADNIFQNTKLKESREIDVYTAKIYCTSQIVYL